MGNPAPHGFVAQPSRDGSRIRNSFSRYSKNERVVLVHESRKSLSLTTCTMTTVTAVQKSGVFTRSHFLRIFRDARRAYSQARAVRAAVVPVRGRGRISPFATSSDLLATASESPGTASSEEAGAPTFLASRRKSLPLFAFDEVICCFL